MGGSRGSRGFRGSRGGGSCSRAVRDPHEDFEQNPCQICDDSSHIAVDCPWVYSACRLCGGVRRVWVSRVPKSLNKKFLRCQFQPGCNEFQWLDTAIRESFTLGQPPQHNGQCCFNCGEQGHFKNRCPHLKSPAKKFVVASTPRLQEEEEEEEEEEEPAAATPTKLVVRTTLGELASALKGCKLN